MTNKNWILILSLFLIALLSCSKKNSSQEPEPSVDLPAEGIEITDAWARPGSTGGTSAIYMNVLNGSTEADSVLSLSSPSAGMVEIHESYEGEGGMMGMREAENIAIPARDVLILEPGGFHIMLMQLKSDLVEGDEIELTVRFAKAGELIVTAPVRSMNQ